MTLPPPNLTQGLMSFPCLPSFWLFFCSIMAILSMGKHNFTVRSLGKEKKKPSAFIGQRLRTTSCLAVGPFYLPRTPTYVSIAQLLTLISQEPSILTVIKIYMKFIFCCCLDSLKAIIWMQVVSANNVTDDCIKKFIAFIFSSSDGSSHPLEPSNLQIFLHSLTSVCCISFRWKVSPRWVLSDWTT